MQEIRSLHDAYGDKVHHRLLAIRNNRPHHGVFLEEGEISEISFPKDSAGKLTDEANKRLQDIREKFDTSGIDIALNVCRFLSAYGFNARETYPVGNTFSEAEKRFLKAMDLDFGWDQDKDMKMKRQILAGIYGNKMIVNKDGSPSSTMKTSFLDVIAQLPKFFKENTQFHLVDRYSIQGLPDDPNPEYLSMSMEAFHRSNDLRLDDSIPLAELIEKKFSFRESTKVQVLGSSAKFLKIHYTVKNGGSDISKLRKLYLEIPGAKYDNIGPNKIRITETLLWTATYILCMVVRVTPGKPELFRKYWKCGNEMIPDRVGDHKKKYPLAGFHDKMPQWSIKEPGEYILFYYLEHIPAGWPFESEMSLDAPEFVS
ncbi:hypothetical protein BGAL_0020g00320 [Botrytis galanthina]|uniref:Uncharacterized protein n=1 Tax=Botrytis galanthina TaxID=278940 RepID=A0A4S8R9R7_9HELO|nr:hypothetical protein BGAL_0020g00320 [Botrytis galanthina]